MTREITSDVHLVAACRYLALNPVAAGLVASPFEWPWSSARAHAGLERPRIPLSETDLRAAFGDANDWRERYRAQIEVPDYETLPRVYRRLKESCPAPKNSPVRCSRTVTAGP